MRMRSDVIGIGYRHTSLLAAALMVSMPLQAGAVEPGATADPHHFPLPLGVYTSPPASTGITDPAIGACRIPDGPLLGNGDWAVAIGGTVTSQTWYLSKSDLSQAERGIGAVGVRMHAGPGDAARYRQEQDLAQAEVRSLVPLVGGDLGVRSWTADDADLLVIELTELGDAPMEVEISVWAHHGKAHAVCGRAGDGLWASREVNPGFEGMPVTRTAAMAVRIAGGTVVPGGDSIGTITVILPVHATVSIITAIAGGMGSTTQLPAAQALAQNCDAAALAARHAAHLTWWNAFWARSSVHLDDEQVEKFYYGALYVLVCSSRPGAVAPGLAGPWHLDGPACWDNRYTLDYNFEATWWGAYSSNHADAAEPYYDAILKLIPAGRALASAHCTAGVLFGVNAHAWGGFTDARTLNMKGNASLACMPFLIHWRYTHDDASLLAKVWPLLHELDLFWQDNLTWEAAARRWIIADSSARENGHDLNPINELAYVRVIYGFLLARADRLDGQRSGEVIIRITTEDRMRWRNYLARLASYPTLSEGGRTVFKEAESRSHMSLGGAGDNSDVLSPLFPGEAIAGDDLSGLEIARNTVAALCPPTGKSSWFQANCFPKIFTQAIRAGYPAATVLDNLRLMLDGHQPYDDRGDHARLRANLTITPPAHGIEAIGAIEAIDSMLLQSHAGIIRVFPNWPLARDASFRNLMAEGAFSVSGTCTQGAIGPIDVVSGAGGPCVIESPWPTATPLVITGGKSVPLMLSGRQISFASVRGSPYHISMR